MSSTSPNRCTNRPPTSSKDFPLPCLRSTSLRSEPPRRDRVPPASGGPAACHAGNEPPLQQRRSRAGSRGGSDAGRGGPATDGDGAQKILVVLSAGAGVGGPP